jgi:hypothetical protein
MTGVPMSFGASKKSHSMLAWEPAKHSRIISSARPLPHFALRGIAFPHPCSGINAGGYHGGGDPAHNRTELSGDRTKRLGATAHLSMAVLPAAWSVVPAVSMITKRTSPGPRMNGRAPPTRPSGR